MSHISDNTFSSSPQPPIRLSFHHVLRIMHPGRNAPNSLDDAVRYLRRSMGAARRGRESLPELRTKERALLREWAAAERRIFDEDPTLTLDRRSAHGEHVVAFDPATKIWWKTTHPGKAGIGAEFDYEMLPPFSVIGIFARELLPSEFDAHPGNFFHANGMTIPIDGILAEITADAEHDWLL